MKIQQMYYLGPVELGGMKYYPIQRDGSILMSPVNYKEYARVHIEEYTDYYTQATNEADEIYARMVKVKAKGLNYGNVLYKVLERRIIPKLAQDKEFIDRVIQAGKERGTVYPMRLFMELKYKEEAYDRFDREIEKVKERMADKGAEQPEMSGNMMDNYELDCVI